MKTFFKCLTVGVLSMMLFAAPGFASDTIKVANAGALSGDLAPYGISALRGVEMAVEDINEKGGILGKKVELMLGDDVCKPEVAVNVATKLVSDGAQMVVGHVCSGATIAANKIYKDTDIILISGSATNDDLTMTGDHPNFFRTISNDGAQAKLMTAFAKNDLKVKKVALIHDKGDYGKGQMELAKIAFEHMGDVEIVLFEGVTTGAVDYTAIVQKIKRSDAELVMWGGYHSDASKIIQLMKKKRVDTLFMGADGIYGDNLPNLAGEFAEGVYATGPNDTSSNPMHQALTKEHQEKYGEDPGTFFFTGYTCMQSLAAAAEKAGTVEYDAMRAAMFEITVDSPMGPIGFDENGDIVGAGFSVYRVTDGKYQQVN